MNSNQDSCPTINNSIIRKTLFLVVSDWPWDLFAGPSSESHSIEWFTNRGAWIGTFAATGPRIPLGLAQNPVSHVWVFTN